MQKLKIAIAGFALLCAVLSACGSSPAPTSKADELDAAIRETSDYLNKQLPKGNKLVILNIQSEFPALSEYIIDELIANTVNDRVFTIVDRQQLNAIRAERDFQMSGEVSDLSAQSIGQILGAQIIISGAISKIGDLYRLRIRALTVQNAQIAAQYNRNIPSGPTVLALVGSKATGYGGGTAPATASAPTAQATAPTPAPAQPATPVYKVGDKGPAGGLVFYNKGNNSGGWQYLEAAPANTEKSLTFFVNTKSVQGMYNAAICSDKRIGEGKKHTQTWMREINSAGGGINTAQWYCDQLVTGGYDDWYLPTEDELLYMYNSLYGNGLGGFQGREYWASNDIKSTWYYIIFVNFSNGKVDQSGYDTFNKKERLVRACRQF